MRAVMPAARVPRRSKMKISRLSKNGWKSIHSGTVLAHFTLSKAEMHAPFMLIWAKLEAHTEMTTDQGHPEGEVFVIIEGKSRMIVGEEEAVVCEGDTIYVPPNTPHQAINDTDKEMTVICIKYPESRKT